MRKIKQTLAFVLVLIVVFSMCSLALAYSSNTATWSSTICTNRFTTDQYIEKHLSNATWSTINVQANSVTHTPGGGDDISFRLVTSDGVAMSTIVSWKGGLPPIPFQDMNYPTTNKVHVLVINPLSGTNMASTGQFSGFYY